MDLALRILCDNAAKNQGNFFAKPAIGLLMLAVLQETIAPMCLPAEYPPPARQPARLFVAASLYTF